MFFNFKRKLKELEMTQSTQQAAIDALTSRLTAVAANVATIEANNQPPVDLTALTAEVGNLETAVNAGLPVATTTSDPAATDAPTSTTGATS